VADAIDEMLTIDEPAPMSGAREAVSAAGARRQEVTLMVHDDGPVGLDHVQVDFDDERVVADAGVALVATLAERLGIECLVGRFVHLRRDRPGAAHAGRKLIALVYAMLLGADSIDDCELLRSGRTSRLLGGWLPGALDARHVPARVHLRACAPARPRAR
jgi:hypothetical protein